MKKNERLEMFARQLDSEAKAQKHRTENVFSLQRDGD